jgi:hypothetical protein
MNAFTGFFNGVRYSPSEIKRTSLLLKVPYGRTPLSSEYPLTPWFIANLKLNIKSRYQSPQTAQTYGSTFLSDMISLRNDETLPFRHIFQLNRSREQDTSILKIPYTFSVFPCSPNCLSEYQELLCTRLRCHKQRLAPVTSIMRNCNGKAIHLHIAK